jgi:acetyl esterase/lipase
MSRVAFDWRRIRHMAVLLLTLGTAFLAAPASAQSSFYEATPAEIAGGAPGTLIRSEPLVFGLLQPAHAYRVLYRSVGLKGEPIAVSGYVVVPFAPAPAGGREMIAWAHPTSGIASRCGPSLALLKFQQIQGLRDMIARGYVVAATDYPGLGTPGPHPYLVGTSEGRAVLDILRAARQLPDANASGTVALWGHSQGGQAVLYAATLAKKYAPDLRLVGVAAAAPATDLGTLLKDDIATIGGKNLLAMTLYSWNDVFGAPMDKVIAPAAEPVGAKLAGECLESIGDLEARSKLGRELQQKFLSVSDLTDLQPWHDLLEQNTIGTLPTDIPLFIAQGTADETVDPPVTVAYAKRLCAAGSRVYLIMMPKVSHGFAALKSATSAVAWIADRFAGEKAPTTCAR